MFSEKSDKYPLPDLILCSAGIYKKVMHDNGIEPKQVELVGFLRDSYLKQPPIFGGAKAAEKERIRYSS